MHNSVALLPRLALLFFALNLQCSNATSDEESYVLFTGKNSGVNSIDDLSKLQAKGQKIVCGAFGDKMRASCTDLSRRLRIDIQVESFPSSGPAFAMTASNRVTVLPLSLRLAQSMRPSESIQPIATTAQSQTINGRQVPGFGASTANESSRSESASKPQTTPGQLKAEQAAVGAKAAQSCTTLPDGTVVGVDGTQWQPCPVGQLWTDGKCNGSPQLLDWSRAHLAALEQRHPNGGTWRLPSRADYSRSLGDPSCNHPAVKLEDKRLVSGLLQKNRLKRGAFWTADSDRGALYISSFHFEGHDAVEHAGTTEVRDNMGRWQPIQTVLIWKEPALTSAQEDALRSRAENYIAGHELRRSRASNSSTQSQSATGPRVTFTEYDRQGRIKVTGTCSNGASFAAGRDDVYRTMPFGALGPNGAHSASTLEQAISQACGE